MLRTPKRILGTRQTIKIPLGLIHSLAPLFGIQWKEEKLFRINQYLAFAGCPGKMDLANALLVLARFRLLNRLVLLWGK